MGPQGSKRGPELDLSDRTYDGREEGGILSNGLGQLVDGQKGPDNFRLDVAGHGKGNTQQYLCSHSHLHLYCLFLSCAGTSNNVLSPNPIHSILYIYIFFAIRRHLCNLMTSTGYTCRHNLM